MDLDKGDKAFAVGDGIRDAKFAKPEHGQTNAKDLAGADVAVGDGGEFEVFTKGAHEREMTGRGYQISGISDQEASPTAILKNVRVRGRSRDAVCELPGRQRQS